jgi:hypothetical protein
MIKYKILIFITSKALLQACYDVPWIHTFTIELDFPNQPTRTQPFCSLTSDNLVTYYCNTFSSSASHHRIIILFRNFDFDSKKKKSEFSTKNYLN